MNTDTLFTILSGGSVKVPDSIKRETALSFLSFIRGAKIIIAGQNKITTGRGIWYKTTPKQLFIRVANLSVRIMLNTEMHIRLTPLPMLIIGSTKSPRIIISGLSPVDIDDAIRKIMWKEDKK